MDTADRMWLEVKPNVPEEPVLHIGGRAFQLDDNGQSFEVVAAAVKGLKLSDIPLRARIRLCDRVIGSDELCSRWPDVVLQKLPAQRGHKGQWRESYLVRCNLTVCWPDDTEPEPQELQKYLDEESARLLQRIHEIWDKIGVRSAGRRSYGEFAEVRIELILPDQLILDAEAFVGQLERALVEGLSRRLLFVCHASEDGPFIERLVDALDRRALSAWYDKREIIVGDSIVDKINQGLGDARYLLVVLSPRSVEKPWVKRELNATLMRQLNAAEVKVLPVLLEDCNVPPLLADIKYADFRTSFDQGLSELLPALRGVGH